MMLMLRRLRLYALLLAAVPTAIIAAADGRSPTQGQASIVDTGSGVDRRHGVRRRSSTWSQTSTVQVDVSAIGPRVGAVVPDFQGVDQFGARHTLQSTLGPKGAMLVFFRSADW